jgi:hypothetical protein
VYVYEMCPCVCCATHVVNCFSILATALQVIVISFCFSPTADHDFPSSFVYKMFSSYLSNKFGTNLDFDLFALMFTSWRTLSHR